MDDKNFISIVDDEGNEAKFELLNVIESDDQKDQFIIYTDNEEDSDGNVNIYASKSILVDGVETLVDLTDSEWDDVKAFLEEAMEDEEDD